MKHTPLPALIEFLEQLINLLQKKTSFLKGGFYGALGQT